MQLLNLQRMYHQWWNSLERRMSAGRKRGRGAEVVGNLEPVGTSKFHRVSVSSEVS
jgi:hypothetical protein